MVVALTFLHIAYKMDNIVNIQLDIKETTKILVASFWLSLRS